MQNKQSHQWKKVSIHDIVHTLLVPNKERKAEWIKCVNNRFGEEFNGEKRFSNRYLDEKNH